MLIVHLLENKIYVFLFRLLGYEAQPDSERATRLGGVWRDRVCCLHADEAQVSLRAASWNPKGTPDYPHKCWCSCIDHCKALELGPLCAYARTRITLILP